MWAAFVRAKPLFSAGPGRLRRITTAQTSIPEVPDILITTRGKVEGRIIIHEVGLVSAAHVGSQNIFKDITMALLGAFGGENRHYSDLLGTATEEAIKKLASTSRDLGATAVVRTRFQTAVTMNRFVFGLHASVLVYGTAVYCRPMTDRERAWEAKTTRGAMSLIEEQAALQPELTDDDEPRRRPMPHQPTPRPPPPV